MSLESVKEFFAEKEPSIKIVELDASLATIAMAANVLGVPEGQIAKTLSMRIGEEVILLVTRGDARIDNSKFKRQFGVKAKLLQLEEVEPETGHPVGGVTPFGLKAPLRVFCDTSLNAFNTVFPAAGAHTAVVPITPSLMATLVSAQWVDVTKAMP